MGSRSWDAEWLDFTAELLTAGIATLPLDRVAVRLAATLESVACAVARPDGWQVAVPEGRRDDRWDRPAWEAYFGSLGAVRRLEVAVELAGGRCTTFVLGRQAAYADAEVAFARRLQRLLVGIDHHIAGIAAGSAPAEDGDPPLTERETTVLALMATGMTAAAAARRLEIAERTVHKHLERAYRKLDVSDRMSAVHRARTLGLLSSADRNAS